VVKNVRRAVPKLRLWIKLFNQRMQEENWPPPGCSPMHPIEPWGKQFAVFNAAEVAGPDSQKPRRGVDGEPVRTRTVMCVMSPFRRPMMFLSRDDFEALAVNLPFIKKQLEVFAERKERDYPEDLRYEKQRALLPRTFFQKEAATPTQRAGFGQGHRTFSPGWRSVFRQRKT